MKATDFEKSNKRLGKPSTMIGKDCGSLDVFTDDKQCISKWRGSFWERIKFLFTGRMWLSVRSGQSQPPVWLKVDYPFEKKPYKPKMPYFGIDV